MKGEELLHGKKVNAFSGTFGEVSALVQTCRVCGNDTFVVMFTKQKGTEWLSLICPKCDTGHFNLNITESFLIGVTQ